MLKITGLLTMVLALGFTGIMKSDELKARIHLLEDMQNMLLSLKSQMQYFREPLQILLSKLAKTADSRAFSLLDCCAVMLEEKNGQIGQIWAQCTGTIYEKTPLTEEDRSIIVQIGSYLGQTDFEGQQIQFECTEQRLSQQIGEARELYGRKGPMYRKLGFLLGTAAALLAL